MTVSTTTNIASYDGNGSQVTFPYTFKIFAESDLIVVVINNVTGVETTQVLNTDYTVTNVGNDLGGNVVFTSAPASATTVFIRRFVPETQTTDYVENDPFPAESHEDALDKLTMIAQQLRTDIDRSIQVPEQDVSDIDTVLPTSANRANKLLGFTAGGDATVTTTTVSQLDAAVSSFVNATGNNASSIIYDPAGSGAVQTTVQAKLREFVSVDDFGAKGDAVFDSGTSTWSGTDDTSAIQAAFDASTKVYFPPGNYLFGNITIADDDVDIDCTQATIINSGSTFLFDIGTTSDTPVHENVQVRGGHFVQQDATTTGNQNYIRIRGVEHFVIRDCFMENVSNGGIYVEAGSAYGLIDGCTIKGATGYSTIRGIWLIGATASDYASFYMDDATLARNATAFPQYYVDNVRVTNCYVATGSYGIYNMNTRDCVFENNYLENFGGARGLTINTYSPRAIIKNNTIVGSGSSSGILVTQASDGVIIDGNTFRGGFGGGRAIQVQYLAEALIVNNYFLHDGSQSIDLNTAGTATIRGNYFKRTFGTNSRAVYALPVDRNTAGTGTLGDSATLVPGFVFENNIISGWGIGILLATNTSAGGNVPGWERVIVRNNIMYEMDNATTSSEYLLRPVNTSTTQDFFVHYYDNTVFPESAAHRNLPLVSGDVVFERSSQYLTTFSVSVAVSGGAITVNKGLGAHQELTVTRTGTDLLLTPRSPSGAVIAQQVPKVIAITPNDNSFVRYEMIDSTNDYTLTLIDSAGSDLDMTSDAASFTVTLITNVS